MSRSSRTSSSTTCRGRPAPGTGWAGTAYSEERYPGPEGGYGPQDFHSCKTNISNYNDRYQVQNCRLVGLQDLDTGSDYVRSEIAAYLNDLISLGVRGFRVDASKHIAAGDLEAIRGKLTDQSVYIEHEVIAGGGEPIQPAEYFGSGDSNEFNYSRNLKSVFQSGNLVLARRPQGPVLAAADRQGRGVRRQPRHRAQRRDAELQERLRLPPGQRVRAELTRTAGRRSTPATRSATTTPGAPQQSNGKVNDAVCGQGTWTCAHRWNETAHMVGFRNAVGTAALTNVWSDGGRLAYGRGSLGYVAINRNGSRSSARSRRRCPAGRYCDVISGATTSGGCSGTTVTVASGGSATFTVPANGSVAAARRAARGRHRTPTPTRRRRPTGASQISFGVNATTSWGQNIFVVGDRAELGSWNPASAIALSSATYPVWRASVRCPPARSSSTSTCARSRTVR